MTNPRFEKMKDGWVRDKMPRKELARFSRLKICKIKSGDLMWFCLGKNIVNNPNVLREDDLITGDVVFFEIESELPKGLEETLIDTE